MNAMRFSPLDTWFFKEARPMDGFGGMELSSTFPPPARTLMGAFRTAIGDSQNVNWKRFPHDYTDLVKRIGDATHYGMLRSHGVFIEFEGKVFFPIPLHVIHRNGNYAFMTIGEAIQTDIGDVRFPRLPPTPQGETRYEIFSERKAWVSLEDLTRILEGKPAQNVLKNGDLFEVESRVGIAAETSTRVVKEGQFYQTQHLRLKPNVKVVLTYSGIETTLSTGMCRLGGEGRGAHYEMVTLPPIQAPSKAHKPVLGVTVILMTPAIIDPLKPLGENVPIESACVGKSYREGGFDVNTNASRTAKNYTPAGSVWFIALPENEATTFIKTWHETHIGLEQELGRGRIVCGYWTE